MKDRATIYEGFVYRYFSGIMPRDPVCGAEVPENVEFRVEYRGKTYYFCCEHCMNAFKRNPERYVSKAG